MFWKKEDNTEKKLKQINEIIKKSFANVKRDTTNIFQWLNYFYRRGMEQEHMLKQLQLELSYVPKTREEIRHIIDSYYSFDGIIARMKELEEKVDELAKLHREKVVQIAPHVAPKETIAEIIDIEKRLERLEHKKSSMKERIVKRLMRNSKEYVKSVILSYIKKYERISALQLKEIVVDEQNFCSKSSFYRLLDEIEQLEEVGVMKHGKEKHYMSKTLKHIQHI
ncbi:hypothetical protein HYY70_03080 [Candidatus Woesearchaeota archaeon]|nr:hypothetical protein [Candidatus Woesearchaeota archaeon]